MDNGAYLCSKAENPAKNQGAGNCHMRCLVAPLCLVLWCQHTWLRSAIPGDGGRAAIHGQVRPWHGQRGPTSPDQPLPGCVTVAGSRQCCCLPRGTGAAARNEWLCWSCLCAPAFHISSLASAGEHGGFVGRWQSPLSSQGKGLLVNKRQGACMKDGCGWDKYLGLYTQVLLAHV